MTGRAVFTEAYAVIPRGVMSDIVRVPCRLGRSPCLDPRASLSGFAESFAQI